MPCVDVATTLAAACLSGIGKVSDPIMLQQIIAQNLCEASLTSPPVTFLALATFADTSPVVTTWTTSSYAPASNALVLAFIFKSSANNITSVTGNGLTWVLVRYAETSVGNLQGVHVYRAMGVAPTPGGLTVNTSGTNTAGIIIHVQQYVGANTGGTNGSYAIVQSPALPLNNLTIAPFNPNGLNATVGASVIQANPTGATLEGGWTQDVNQGQTPSFALGAFVAHQLLSTDNSFNSAMAGDVASLQIEIRSAASGNYITLPSALANLEIWCRSDTGIYQDAAKTIPCVANGDPVWTWDNMGNTALVADFVQATGALQPTYNATGGANGRPRISFNSNRLRLASGSFAQPFTIVVVAKYTSTVGNYAPLLWDDPGTSFLTIDAVLSDTTYVYAGILDYSTIKLGTSPGILICQVNSPAGCMLFTNSVRQLNTGNAGANGIVTGITTGGELSATYYLIGDEYEMMFFSRSLTLSEISQIQIYAADRYALQY